jgi:hypothetical protein
MQQDAEKRHREVLDMIEAFSDTTSSDGASNVWKLHSCRRINTESSIDKQGLFRLSQQVNFH